MWPMKWKPWASCPGAPPRAGTITASPVSYTHLGAGHVDELVALVKGAGAGGHFVPKDAVDEHAAAHIFGHILVGVQRGDLPGGQVDAGDPAAVAIQLLRVAGVVQNIVDLIRCV